ncbi:HEPN domain-containing protein [Flavobacterium sp. FlaQc-52]|uniref:HEPN domain-containing protein n=1 Tax=Flavobacterium sp. FlaQc-52 TaxID=3374185 RepID=UPI00375641A6
MRHYLDDFHRDLDDISNTFSVLRTLEELRTIEQPTEPISSTFLDKALELHPLVDTARNGMAKIPGIFILYIGGRFEDYVKTIFEEFAIQFAQKHPDYSSLPSKFQSSIVQDTSLVIASPRKFGYGDIMQKTFIENLFKNVIGNDFGTINHQCLSITEGNMRSDILNDLFSKISISNIWSDIGQQLAIRTFFETADSTNATSQARKYLDEFMNLRNQVAHPSGGSFTWPSYDDVIKHINYFKVLSPVLLDLGAMKINSLSFSVS